MTAIGDVDSVNGTGLHLDGLPDAYGIKYLAGAIGQCDGALIEARLLIAVQRRFFEYGDLQT